MKTITAKELRDNLESIGKRVSMGEQIKVTYRHKPIFTLMPSFSIPDKKTPGRKMPGLEALIKSPRKDSGLDKNKSIKQLYHELLEEKHGGK